MDEQRANEKKAQADMGSAGGRYASRRQEGTRRDSAVDRQEGVGAQACAARREAERRERRQEERDGPAFLTASERMNEHVPRRFIQPNMRRMHR